MNRFIAGLFLRSGTVYAHTPGNAWNFQFGNGSSSAGGHRRCVMGGPGFP